MNAFDYACGTLWAMESGALEQLLAIASREGDVVRAREIREARLEALAARDGRPLDGASPSTTVRDGVATISVIGPMFHHASLFTEISGATSYDALAKDLQLAVDAKSVRAILLDLDSPGGQVGGAHDLAAMIRAARDQKPIAAHVSSQGASAAYWLASACSEVVTNPTGMLGSIGVIAVARSKDPKSRDREFVSSVSPRKVPDPETESGRAQMQEMVDESATVFVDSVAMNRGVSRKKVLTDFGQGGMLVGERAIKAGLADRISSYEAVHRELSSGAFSGNSTKKRATTPRAATMNFQEWALGRLFGASAAAAEEPELSADQVRAMFEERAASGKPLAKVFSDSTTLTPNPASLVYDPTTKSARTVASEPSAETLAELERLRAFRDEQVAAVGGAAEAFALDAVQRGRITPAERPFLAALHAHLARVDLGVAGKAIEVAATDGTTHHFARSADLLAHMTARRPESALKGEVIVAPVDLKGVAAVDNGASGGETDDQKKSRELKERTRARVQAQTAG